MLVLYIAVFATIVLFILWCIDSRIFLFLWYKAFFRAKQNPPFLHQEKETLFTISKLLENNWEVIQVELLNFLAVNNKIPRLHEMDAAQHKISFDKGPAWRTVLLKAYDQWIDANCEKFPLTTYLLKQSNQISTALFSILEPGVVIPGHTGKMQGFYRYHLAIQVPEQGDCFIKVGGEEYRWKQGEGVLFDDIYFHEVKNLTAEYRIVLFLDVKRALPTSLQWVDRLCHWLIAMSPKFSEAKRKGIIKID